MTGTVRRTCLLLPLLFALACDRSPPDLREWRPTDHDHTTNPGTDQVEGGPDAGVSAELAAHGLNEVVLVAWEENCVRCHGRFGRGDGPQGPMVHAADLSNPAWQSQVSDADIATIIRDGRGLMPKFPFPDSTLKALVQLVRLLNRAGEPAAGAAASASAALPPGHPSVATSASAATAGALPPGHPRIVASAAAAAPAHVGAAPTVSAAPASR